MPRPHMEREPFKVMSQEQLINCNPELGARRPGFRPQLCGSLAVILGKSFALSEPQSFHLCNGVTER